MSKAKLHLVCGKIGSGKSTLAKTLSRPPGTIRISEDAWLSSLFGDQMSTVQDYVHFSAKLRQIMGPHVEALLHEGLSVVLDYPANTIKLRAWMRGIADHTGVDATLHYLDVSDEVCLARMEARAKANAHPFTVTRKQFDAITRHFEPPTPDEGLTIIRHQG